MLYNDIVDAEIFLKALVAWDEFWATIRLGWRLLEDPRRLPTERLQKWLRKPALIYGEDARTWLSIWIAKGIWDGLGENYPGYPVWQTSFQIPIDSLSTKQLRRIERDLAMYPRKTPQDHSLFFQALCSTQVSMPELAADINLDELPKEAKTEIEEESKESLGQLRKEISKELEGGIHMPTKLGAAYLLAHRSVDWLGLIEPPLPQDWWIYAFFGGKVHPIWPHPNPPEEIREEYRYFSEFRESIEKAPTGGQKLSEIEAQGLLLGNEEGEFERKYESFEFNLNHPLHKVIHVVKFGKVEWVEKIKRDEQIKACFENRENVEELLIQEMREDAEIITELRYLLEAKGRERFPEFFRKRADRVYRRVCEHFRRRGYRMPTPPKGWRRRCQEEILSIIKVKKLTL